LSANSPWNEYYGLLRIIGGNLIMMRSLFSGVSGLKTHQTRMDVIGNNIANVNTTAYKSKSINFSDMLYQTTQSATAPNDANNTAGTNARQIGLGVKTGAINTSITTEGSSQSTGNPFDLKITGEAFFIVTDGTNQYFTRDGSFDVDSAGNLCMSSTGYIVEGWTNTDSETGAIIQDSVQPIKVMSVSNNTYPAAYTTSATISGIIDMNDDQLETDSGKLMNIQVLDNRGYEYNLKFGITPLAGNVTRQVQNTETVYTLPASLTAVSTPNYSYSMLVNGIDNGDLSGVTIPDDLTTKLNDLAKTARANSKTSTDSSGNEYFDVELLDTNTAITAQDSQLQTATELAGKTIRVYITDDVTYQDATQKTVEISDAALKALYTQDTTDTTKYTLNSSNATPQAAGVKIVAKQYTVDNEDITSYELYLAQQDGTAIGGKISDDTLTYAQVSTLLGSATKSEQVGNYVTSESVSGGVTEGSYKLKLVGMTDSDGEEVEGWDTLSIATEAVDVVYDTGNGKFISVDGGDAFTVALSTIGSGNFSDVSFDMTNTSNVNNGGKSTVAGTRDDGRKVGQLTGVAIGQDGTITANYDNGMQKTIAQISVATFANAMGLENAGDNLYQQTSNSGEFDGVGVDIKGSGTGYMTTGVLEMSNVDLSQEFTDMITTQRGFQANSRVITVSDTLLEELVNLKR
jgi:flagellar hook protein FlgE